MSEHGISAILITYQPNMFYLSGFTGTSGFLLVTPNKQWLFTDFRYIEQARVQSSIFEIVKVEGGLDYEKAINYLSKEGFFSLAVEEEYLPVKAYKHIKDLGRDLKIVAAGGIIERIREIKDEKEIEHVALAAEIADNAFKDVLPLIRPGVSEFDIGCELEYALRKKGSERIPFTIIVASGYRSALPHGVATRKIIQENDLVTIDFGAVYAGYCSDMTRTFVVGKPDKKQTQILELVFQAQEMAFENIKIGVDVTTIDSLVRRFFSKHGFGENFGHGLGHGVGLEVHEKPSLSPKGQGKLRQGMVFTIEPGLYFKGWGGVRIEDLVVLRNGGPERLTQSAKFLSYH